MPNSSPARGFPVDEFQARVARAQAAMCSREMDGIVLSMPQNFRYFSGFDSQFWESPTRPFFVVVPSLGEPIAVVPSIGGPAMATTCFGVLPLPKITSGKPFLNSL